MSSFVQRDGATAKQSKTASVGEIKSLRLAEMNNELNSAKQTLLDAQRNVQQIEMEIAKLTGEVTITSSLQEGHNYLCSLPTDVLNIILGRPSVFPSPILFWPQAVNVCKMLKQIVQRSCKHQLVARFPFMNREFPQESINWLLRLHTLSRFPFVCKYLDPHLDQAIEIDWLKRYRVLAESEIPVPEVEHKFDMEEYSFTLSVFDKDNITRLVHLPLKLGVTGEKVSKCMLDDEGNQGDEYTDDVPCFRAEFPKPLKIPVCNVQLTNEEERDFDIGRDTGDLERLHFHIHAHHSIKNGTESPCTKFTHFLNFETPWDFQEGYSLPLPTLERYDGKPIEPSWSRFVSPEWHKDYFDGIMVKINTDGTVHADSDSSGDGYSYNLKHMSFSVNKQLGISEWHEQEMSMKELEQALISLKWA